MLRLMHAIASSCFAAAIATSGQSSLTKGRIAAAHGWCSGIQQVAPHLGPTRVYNPNSISIGSAIFAQLTAECPYTLQWAMRSLSLPILPFPAGDRDRRLTRDSLGSFESKTQTASRSVQPFCRVHYCVRQIMLRL